MSEDAAAALAELVALPLPRERLRGVAELLETLTRDGGGVTPDEVVGIEPPTNFDATWPS